MNTLLLLSLAPENAWLQAVVLVVGVAVVLEGAEWLTQGAVAVAARMGVPQIVIGLTVVAMGTSMPEFCVSLVSALKGTPDLAVGNVVGSNIFNALLIVGVAAMVSPITILRSTVRKDIPFALGASVVLFAMCADGAVSRLDAAVLFALFLVFMAVTLHGAKGKEDKEDKEGNGGGKRVAVARAVALMAGGLACLVVGSQVFVDNASALARTLGVSDAVIGLTIVAGGTSLPELATSAVAAHQGNSGIAIGNVLGSNVFNILMILGITGLVCPMQFSGITSVDLAVMVVSTLLLWLFSFTKYTIARWEGAVLILIFAGYMAYLLGC